MNKPPVIQLDKFCFEESRYHRGSYYWMATSLAKAVVDQGLEPFEYPVAAFDLTTKGFSLENVYDFCFQMKRVLEADYEKYPIILDDLGQVADGYHRICHAIIDGKSSVMAYRLQKMPEQDFTGD